MIKDLYTILKSFFIKEKTFPCIIWDGKKMSYQSLTNSKIKEINNSPKYKGWSAIIDEDKI